MGDRPFRITLFLSTAIFAFTLLSIPSFGAGRLNDPEQQSAQQSRPRKVWTNSDLERLRDNDAISIIGVGLDEPAPQEPTPAAQGAKQKVWTNEDLQKLGEISIVPSSETAPAQPTPSAAPRSSAPAGAAAYGNASNGVFGDPNWYAQQAFTLRQELAESQYELDRYEEGIALAKDRITQPGVNLSAWGYVLEPWISPEAGLQSLETRVGEVEIKLDNLRDLARLHSISPGALGE